jgi:addiction module HigA family antidote
MNGQKNKKRKPSVATKELSESQIWSDDKMNKLKEFILTESKKQSPERKLRNELLSIKYQMQDYIAKDKVEREMQILDFVKLYLKLLKITQRELASAFEMKDTNLYKYLKGDRKLNPDIALKLSSFSHTQPELWYYIQTKNELYELRKEKDNLKKYQKYDYENFTLAH